jgi:hypothetical protein
MEGMVIRLASYHNGGFKEGVSLTLYDELARWEKYAYGCSELVFHPLQVNTFSLWDVLSLTTTRYQWPYRGPLTRLFLRFLWSNIAITSKTLIVAYICTCEAAPLFISAINPLTKLQITPSPVAYCSQQSVI